MRFNSMIVRLKGDQVCEIFVNVFVFQFYDSPIKRTAEASLTSRSFFCFNSMIVRLKGAHIDLR